MQVVWTGTSLSVSQGGVHIRSTFGDVFERLPSDDIRDRLRLGCEERSPESRWKSLASVSRWTLGADGLLVHLPKCQANSVLNLLKTISFPIVLYLQLLS